MFTLYYINLNSGNEKKAIEIKIYFNEGRSENTLKHTHTCAHTYIINLVSLYFSVIRTVLCCTHFNLPKL